MYKNELNVFPWCRLEVLQNAMLYEYYVTLLGTSSISEIFSAPAAAAFNTVLELNSPALSGTKLTAYSLSTMPLAALNGCNHTVRDSVFD